MALFDSANSLGSQSNEDIAEYLTLINDTVAAQDFIGANVAGQGGLFSTKAWKHNGSVFGFINDIPDPTTGLCLIQNASAIQPDASLIGQSIKISLDCFYVHSYPGFGAHNVLFDFGGKSQINAALEDIRHPLKFRINDQANASVSGTPIFLGLNVSQNGVSFEGRTINVDSSDDQQIIALFESSVFKTGLTLINTACSASTILSSSATIILSS
ncbi:hypothetical protein [Methylotenera sp.]|uniref:hypothetical protein n=1 Tax=Methylotenera sp. TaxID=2051956 RepID=UPI00272F7611|nr:hypothetical protein [Methylotenera sp.]MDP2072585.1 hypothetical protein [Methylotenera sp.]MDP3006054.1 hypothetical protein [Methylotenera sp.]